MKKNNMIMLALLAGALSFASCSEDELEVQSGVQNPQMMTFVAQMPNEAGNDASADTRAYLNANHIYWDVEDKISVFPIPETGTTFKNYELQLVSGNGKSAGSFNGLCPKSTSGYWAVYPYDAGTTVSVQNSIRYRWDGAHQEGVLNSFPKNTPMVAYASAPENGTSTVPLSFKNVCAFLKFTTDYACNSVTFKAKTASTILASENVLIEKSSDGTYDMITLQGNESTTITLTGKDGAPLNKGTYYIAMRPCTITGGFDLTFSGANSTSYTKSTTNTLTLVRNKVVDLGKITLTGTAVQTLQGMGTAESPFLISNFDQLCLMRDWINKSVNYASYYKQTCDIDGKGAEFTPIGTVIDSEPHRFNGTYDGGGFTLRNIKPTTAWAENKINSYEDTKNCYVTALFAFLLDGTIKNLNVENIDITGKASTVSSSNVSPSYVFSPLIGIAFGSGNSSTTVENVTVQGTQTEVREGYYYTFGGIVAISMNHLNITNCTNYTTLENKAKTTKMRLGGIVGSAYRVTRIFGLHLPTEAHVNINKCRNYGSITENNPKPNVSHAAFIGGILGYGYDEPLGGSDIIPIISNCVNFGNISISRSDDEYYYGYVGGIVGNMDSDGYHDEDPYIKNCINNGALNLTVGSGDSYAGGIIGKCYDDDTHFINCANIGAISSQGTTANIVGNGRGKFSGCDTRSSLTAYIEWMNDHKDTGFCTWKYAEGSNNTKLDLDF